jgi:hypothetical protein
VREKKIEFESHEIKGHQFNGDEPKWVVSLSEGLNQSDTSASRRRLTIVIKQGLKHSLRFHLKLRKLKHERKNER